MIELRSCGRSHSVPLFAWLLLTSQVAQRVHSDGGIRFGDRLAPNVEVGTASALREAIQGGAKHILVTDHLDARSLDTPVSSDATFMLQHDVIIQGKCQAAPSDEFGPFSPPLLPLEASQCVLISDGTLFATGSGGAVVSLDSLYLRMQRSGEDLAVSTAMVTITGSAVWMTGMTLQGDYGSALAIHPSEDAQVHVSGSTIHGWNGTVGPVAIVERNSSLVLDDCTVADNTNTPGRPALYGRHIKDDTPSTVVLRAARLSGNAVPFFGEWLPRSATFFSDAALTVLLVDGDMMSAAQPLSGLGRDSGASVLTAKGNPLLALVGDDTSTDDPSADLTLDASPSGTGIVFGRNPTADDDSAAANAVGAPLSSLPASAGLAPASTLAGPVSISTDSNNPVMRRTADGGDVESEPTGRTALVFGLIVAFAVVASSLVTLIAVVLVYGELRRRKRKKWLEFSDEDCAAASVSVGEINHDDCQGLPESTQAPGQRAPPELRRDLSLHAHMLVANATFDPDMSPTAAGAATARSAARYVQDSLALTTPRDEASGGSDWEGGYGAQCDGEAAAAGGTWHVNSGSGSGSGSARMASGAMHSILTSDSDSDSSSLDFDMRGITTYNEVSADLPR
eukprot:jgi/Ulvmu1/3316/UM154_0008.1